MYDMYVVVVCIASTAYDCSTQSVRPEGMCYFHVQSVIGTGCSAARFFPCTLCATHQLSNAGPTCLYCAVHIESTCAPLGLKPPLAAFSAER